MGNPEQVARQEIDRLLGAAGWAVQDVAQANLHAARGVAIREFALACGHDAKAFGSPASSNIER
jgi:type I restriction enzyme R subunit